jgi:hypothetical protein
MNKKIVFGLGAFAVGLGISFALTNMNDNNEAAVMKLRDNQFSTPEFLYAKSGIYKDGSAFDGYTFSEGIRLKPEVQKQAKIELKGFTGCIDANIQSFKSDKYSRKKYHQINSFKMTDCPKVLN